jgi:hypothetical protein
LGAEGIIGRRVNSDFSPQGSAYEVRGKGGNAVVLGDGGNDSRIVSSCVLTVGSFLRFEFSELIDAKVRK